MKKEVLKSPFPWFGGKSRVAHEVWKRFGNVPNYVEPFFGSGAVLLGRPRLRGTETINDKDCYVSNFWRALKNDPEKLAHYADWPVNEADLHSRHTWLVNREKFRERMKTDPDYFSAKIAGWWVWGISCWIGSGWCLAKEVGEVNGIQVSRRRPHLSPGGGTGVHRKRVAQSNSGMGVHRTSLDGLQNYFNQLAARLRNARVCCGDWNRVCGPSPTYVQGLTAVFLDPPYSADANRSDALYTEEDYQVAHSVKEWCLENGNNKMLRIALCGYEGEGHEELEGQGWSALKWKPSSGYSNCSRKLTVGKDNRSKERIWFSPACLKIHKRRTLLDTLQQA